MRVGEYVARGENLLGLDRPTDLVFWYPGSVGPPSSAAGGAWERERRDGAHASEVGLCGLDGL